jgi:hypothetical protein
MLFPNQSQPPSPQSTEWRRKEGHKLLDSLADASEEEMEWMRTWNDGVQENVETAQLCQQRLQAHDVTCPPDVWMAHLLNLWDERQIGREDLLT